MKKAFGALASALILLTLTVSPVAADRDANTSVAYESIDAFALAMNGDVNADGEIDSLDAAAILKYDVGSIDAFTASSPREELSTEAEEQICSDYFDSIHREWDDYTADDVSVRSYYGNYNGCHAVMMDGYWEVAMGEYTVVCAGYAFHYGVVEEILIYKDGAFYTMPQAYENGYITAEDVFAIGKIKGTAPADLFDIEKETVRNVFGDVNNDGEIDSLDAALILKYDVGL